MTQPTLARAALAAAAWAALWVWGYGPADYPVRWAVRAFGRPAEVRTTGMRRSGWRTYDVEFTSPAGTVVADKTSESAVDAPGWNRLLVLELGGRRVYRLAAGLPFGLRDYLVTLALALLLTRLWVPGFLGLGPTTPKAGALRLPRAVLLAADAAFAACVVLGPEKYSAAQAWATVALWSGLRAARFTGRLEFFRFVPPAAEPPRLTLPGDEAAPVRAVPARVGKDFGSFLSHTTGEGWSRLPAFAAAAGLLVLACVNGRNHLVRVPEPGYTAFGLTLGGWSALGWGLVALALAGYLRQFLSAWRRSED
ncbi:hypothetical protein EPO15_04980 [bacterium]|nr:MAG: hypothetical protein EPO15_04980 [bacterium]